MRALAIVLALAALVQRPEPSESDGDWLNAHQDEALERLMPVASTPGLIAAYRTHRDLYYDVQESYFALHFAQSSPLRFDDATATVTVPVGRSVQQQLLELHIVEADASFETLLPRVAVRRTAMTSAQCPAIRKRIDALLKTSITIPNQNIIRFHPTVHRIVISLLGVELDATLHDPESPAVRWATATSKALMACVAS